jgi:hypothetical protein
VEINEDKHGALAPRHSTGQRSDATYGMIISVLSLETTLLSTSLATIPNLKEYKLVDGLLMQDHWIVVPNHPPLYTNILKMCHNHPLASHFGVAKTIKLVNQQYYWPAALDFVQKYIKSCTNCGWAKVQQHKPYRPLCPLPVPEQPWTSIQMDYIEELPESEGYTAILVIVDQMTKSAIFIECHNTINTAELAQLFVMHVFSKHGVLLHITSD